MILYIKLKTKGQLSAAYASKRPAEIIVDYQLSGDIPPGRRSGVWLSLPDVLRENQIPEFRKALSLSGDFKGFVIHNTDELGMLMRAEYAGPVIAGEFLYAYNSDAVKFYQGLYPDMKFIAPAELTDAELAELESAAGIKFIYKVYGHQQLMTTAQVLDGSFKDAKGESFSGEYDSELNLSRIYTGRPVSMLDKPDVWQDHDILIDFTLESGRKVSEILSDMSASGYTRGHHFRGID